MIAIIHHELAARFNSQEDSEDSNFSFPPFPKSQIFGILFTHVSSTVLEKYSDLHSNILLCVCLLIGLVMTASIRNQLKRQNAFEKTKNGQENAVDAP